MKWNMARFLNENEAKRLLMTIYDYLRLEPSNKANVYDLKVVPKSMLKGEYFTISASGVVFVSEDGKNSEFTSIGKQL